MLIGFFLTDIDNGLFFILLASTAAKERLFSLRGFSNHLQLYFNLIISWGRYNPKLLKDLDLGSLYLM